MHHIATLTRRPAVVIAAVVPAAVSRWSVWWRSAWHELTMDADERFIRGACDLADLEWHEAEFLGRRSFAYTVMDPTETECLGCVYVYPLAVGTGIRLFADGAPQTPLSLLGAEGLSNGVAHLTYGPATG